MVTKQFGLSACSFCIGIGLSLAFTAIQSSVAYWTPRYGKDSYIWINVAIYAPSLPVSLLVYWLNDNEKRKCMSDSQKLYCDTRRVLVCLTFLSSFSLLIPTVTSLAGLLALSLCIGLFSSFAFCVAVQVVMRNSPGGVYEAALTFGYQASVFVTLIIEVMSSLQPTSSVEDLWVFFGLNASVSLACMVPTWIFARHWMWAESDASVEGSSVASTPLLPSQDTEEGMLYTGSPETPSKIELFKEICHGWTALFLTTLGSLSIFPFFSFVPSAANEPMADAMLAMKVFYAKAICDTISRPLTLVLPRFRSRWGLVIASALRLGFVPFFLVYCFSSLIPRNDIAVCGLVGLYSFFSGFFVTSSYQMVAGIGRTKAQTRQAASLMNIGFQLGIYTAFVFALSFYFNVPH